MRPWSAGGGGVGRGMVGIQGIQGVSSARGDACTRRAITRCTSQQYAAAAAADPLSIYICLLIISRDGGRETRVGCRQSLGDVSGVRWDVIRATSLTC